MVKLLSLFVLCQIKTGLPNITTLFIFEVCKELCHLTMAHFTTPFYCNIELYCFELTSPCLAHHTERDVEAVWKKVTLSRLTSPTLPAG